MCTLASSAVGRRTYSSAPLSRMSCIVKAPGSPRLCSDHETCASVTWRTVIDCSVCCSATGYSFPVCDSVRLSCPKGIRLNSPARSLCFGTGGVTSSGEVLVVEAYRVPDGVFGLLRIGEVAHVYLLAFQHLVVLEEALELRQPVLWQLAVVFVGAELGVVEVYADDLFVALAFVDHVHHPDRARLQQAKGLDRFLHQDKHVQRIVVISQSPWDKTVVGRVDHCRVQDSVDLQQPRLLVQLVLDPGAFGDLDQGCELFRGFLPDRDVVPGMGHLGGSFQRT